MRYTHAILARIPQSVKFEDKKTASKVDLAVARKQQEDLSDTLKEAGINVIELPPEESCPPTSLFTDDAAIVINGTALITRQKKPGARNEEIERLLQDLAWNVVKTPAQEHGKAVVLEGSDVLYTGKEIFVGIRKNGTNMEGALVVGRTFADLSVVPLEINGKMPLKHYVSVATDDVLTVSKSKESQNILHKIERHATFRYKVLTLEEENACACINVNNHLIFRHDLGELKFQMLQAPIELWGVSAEELCKVGAPFTKYCLLLRRIDNIRAIL
ncbi:NG,NG-dimethylarginine dimethylaminohydrolase 1 [Aphelenchoides avenae]|nr:NG,NG-dimethylarginine dimethylaminohydrolase 1 [Aphelenchus avenae]